MTAVWAAFALAVPAAPLPTPAPASHLKTIVHVRSTPFCNSLGEHFNAAVQPMLANDRDLDLVAPQLTDLSDVFHHPDYQIRYADIRTKLIARVGEIRKSLPFIQQQIDQLRQGESLTKDPGAAKQLHGVAEKLQEAYDKQYQLVTDLTGVIQTMMSYQPPADIDVTQEELAEQSMPHDMKDIKSYLRFDGQRDVIAQSENGAADAAIALAQSRCTAQ